MKAEIIAVGTELLLGEIIDTNSPYLASRLPALGIDLYWATHVGDNMPRIVDIISRAWARSDLLLLTGGLGPTEDDITRESIASFLKEEMRVDPALEAWLRDFFKKRGIPMPERNLKQATLIPSAKALPNPRGTAPGWWVEKDGHVLVSMPGPPRELEHMWENEVRPRLKEKARGSVLVTRVLKVTGLSEALVDEMAGAHLRSPNPSIGVYSKPDGIHLRIGAKADSEETARAMIAPVEEALKKIYGVHLWGVDDETFEGHIGKLMKTRGLTLATMESCTGGLLSSTITDAPGSSAYFKGGFVTYFTEAKIARGVDPALIERHGVISAEVAEAMARGARLELKADIGIGITGVAGPSEQEGKPAGTVYLAVDSERGKKAHFTRHQASRYDVKLRAVSAALFQLRQLLLEW